MEIIRKKLELTSDGAMQRYGWFFEPDDETKPKHWQEFPVQNCDENAESYDAIARQNLIELMNMENE